MTEFLARLFALSLGGGLAVLILLALTRLTRTRYAARWRCLAWLLLSLRLILPLSLLPQPALPQSPISLSAPSLERPLLPQSSPAASQETPPLGDAWDAAPPLTPPQGADASSEPAPAPTASDSARRPGVTLSQALFLLWLLGALGVLAWGTVSHLRLLGYLKRWAVPLSDGELLALYEGLGDRLGLSARPPLLSCPGLAVPMLAGLFRPVLLLPQDSPAGRELEYALLHELIHCRRRDIWRKALALAAAAVHWFNPLIWQMRRAAERDMELCCDQAALAVLPPEEHSAYGQTILSALGRLSARS